jgi:thiosulfate dehydrogenase [quinone] large subunit
MDRDLTDAERCSRANETRWVPRSLLVVLRVYLGVILLITVLGKLTRDAPFEAEMLGFLTAMHHMTPPYLQFVKWIVVPNSSLFSYLVMTGELVAGLALLTGTATRLGAGIAMFLFLNYMLAKGRWFWSPDSEDAAVFFIALVVLLGAAGRVAGLDAYLARRWPSVPLW